MAKNAQTATEVVLSGENSKFEPGWNSLKYPFFDWRIHFRKVFFFTFSSFKPFDLNMILTCKFLTPTLAGGLCGKHSPKKGLCEKFLCATGNLDYLYCFKITRSTWFLFFILNSSINHIQNPKIFNWKISFSSRVKKCQKS